MRFTVIDVAESLLETLSKDEVAELVEILDYYNQGCREDKRAACLRNGCKKKSRPLFEEKCKKGRLKRKGLGESREASFDLHLAASRPVCPLCRR